MVKALLRVLGSHQPQLWVAITHVCVCVCMRLSACFGFVGKGRQKRGKDGFRMPLAAFGHVTYSTDPRVLRDWLQFRPYRFLLECWPPILTPSGRLVRWRVCWDPVMVAEYTFGAGSYTRRAGKGMQ